MEEKKDINAIAMSVILNAGDGRVKVDEALEKMAAFEFDEAEALLAELGFSVFRMSISWSRIFPREDEETPNEEGLLFYDRV